MAITIKKKGGAEVKPSDLVDKPKKPPIHPEMSDADRERWSETWYPNAKDKPLLCPWCETLMKKPCVSNGQSEGCLNRMHFEGRLPKGMSPPTGPKKAAAK